MPLCSKPSSSVASIGSDGIAWLGIRFSPLRYTGGLAPAGFSLSSQIPPSDGR